MFESLLRTKLYIPPPRRPLVPRPGLIRRLNQALQEGEKLALISAPAGFGKTTLVSEWVGTLQYPVAWLSLDPSDDDPGRFFAYFLAALRQLDPGLGRAIGQALGAGQLPPGEVIATTLINDMLTLGGRVLLVLDDFHVIQDSLILQVLEQLITSLPASVTLVLITREDPPLPLARFRANNQLVEIRAQNLRFADPDAAKFLNDVLGLSLSEADVAALQDKTEGWVVGLQLAALAMHSSPSVREEDDPSGFIAALSGSQRFILGYLTEQVLDQQANDVRHFLLQTAILDELNADLCNAVTGRSDGRMMLERLLAANLFLVPLDDEGQWYRYHHLFAGLLRELQDADPEVAISDLHRRASQWFAQNDMVSEAIQHALAAADYEMAVSLLESQAMEMVMQGSVKTVNGWLQAIPGRWRSHSPRTCLALAWMQVLRGAYADASHYLEQLRATLAEPPQDAEFGDDEASLRADWFVMQALVSYMQGDMATSKKMAEQGLTLAPQQDNRTRSLAHYALASVYQARAEYGAATEAYQLAIRYGRAGNALVAEIMGVIGLAGLALEQGQLHLALEITEPAIDRIEQSGAMPPFGGLLYSALAEVYFQWGELARASQLVEQSLQLCRLGGYNTSEIFCHVSLSRIAQLKGDLIVAAREIQTAEDLMPLQLPDYIRQDVVAQRVRLYLARSRLDGAQMTLQGQGFSFQGQFRFPPLPAPQSLTASLGFLFNCALRVLLSRGLNDGVERDLTSGVALASRLIEQALRGQKLPVAIEALLLRAQLRAAAADSQEVEAGEADTARALALGEQEGFISIFVELGEPVAKSLARLLRQNRLDSVAAGYAGRILDSFAALQRGENETRGQVVGQPQPETGDMLEPLTERELDVLRLMAEGLKYKEIAARLFISLNTVRYHVKALYSKLGVNNRTQAIDAARRQHLL